MIIPQQGRFIASLNQFNQAYCVYEHRTIEEKIIFIGVTLLVDVFTFKDARNNSEWVKMMKADTYICCNVLAISENERECWEMQRRLVREHQPHCNMRGFYSRHGLLPIVCDQTGERFRTITEVVRAHGVSASALSNHLNNKPGFRSVKNRTYHREI